MQPVKSRSNPGPRNRRRWSHKKTSSHLHLQRRRIRLNPDCPNRNSSQAIGGSGYLENSAGNGPPTAGGLLLLMFFLSSLRDSSADFDPLPEGRVAGPLFRSETMTWELGCTRELEFRASAPGPAPLAALDGRSTMGWRSGVCGRPPVTAGVSRRLSARLSVRPAGLLRASDGFLSWLRKSGRLPALLRSSRRISTRASARLPGALRVSERLLSDLGASARAFGLRASGRPGWLLLAADESRLRKSGRASGDALARLLYFWRNDASWYGAPRR